MYRKVHNGFVIEESMQNVPFGSSVYILSCELDDKCVSGVKVSALILDSNIEITFCAGHLDRLNEKEIREAKLKHILLLNEQK